jgi:hypothetical protein
MSSVAISPKEITTRELTNRNQMGAYTVPTRVRGPHPVKISKRNINKWEPTLYPLRPADRIPTFFVPTRGQRRKPFG